MLITQEIQKDCRWKCTPLWLDQAGDQHCQLSSTFTDRSLANNVPRKATANETTEPEREKNKSSAADNDQSARESECRYILRINIGWSHPFQSIESNLSFPIPPEQHIAYTIGSRSWSDTCDWEDWADWAVNTGNHRFQDGDMEARLKKIFHRKKDEPSEAPLQQSRKSNAATSTPALRTSLYNDAPAGGLPQTGSYPIKGKDSGAVLPNRRSSLHHRGPSDPISISSRQPSIGNQQNRLRATSITNFRPSTGGVQQTNVGRLPEGDSPLESSSPKFPTSDFSRLSLNHQDGQSVSEKNSYQNLNYD